MVEPADGSVSVRTVSRVAPGGRAGSCSRVRMGGAGKGLSKSTVYFGRALSANVSRQLPSGTGPSGDAAVAAHHTARRCAQSGHPDIAKRTNRVLISSCRGRVDEAWTTRWSVAWSSRVSVSRGDELIAILPFGGRDLPEMFAVAVPVRPITGWATGRRRGRRPHVVSGQLGLFPAMWIRTCRRQSWPSPCPACLSVAGTRDSKQRHQAPRVRLPV